MLQLKSVIVAIYFLAYVSKLYLQLVEAFQATLEEVVEADFLLVSLQHISLANHTTVVCIEMIKTSILYCKIKKKPLLIICPSPFPACY